MKFNKDHVALLAGLVEEDDLEDTRFRAGEKTSEVLTEDAKEYSENVTVLQEGTGRVQDSRIDEYLGFRPEEEIDREHPQHPEQPKASDDSKNPNSGNWKYSLHATPGYECDLGEDPGEKAEKRKAKQEGEHDKNQLAVRGPGAAMSQNESINDVLNKFVAKNSLLEYAEDAPIHEAPGFKELVAKDEFQEAIEALGLGSYLEEVAIDILEAATVFAHDYGEYELFEEIRSKVQYIDQNATYDRLEDMALEFYHALEEAYGHESTRGQQEDEFGDEEEEPDFPEGEGIEDDELWRESVEKEDELNVLLEWSTAGPSLGPGFASWDGSSRKTMTGFGTEHDKKLNEFMDDFDTMGPVDVPMDSSGVGPSEPQFRLDVHYEIWTEEDKEIGETDNKGTHIEDEVVGLEDIEHLKKQLGPFNVNSPPGSPGDYWYSNPDRESREYFERDEEKQYTVHVSNLDGSQLSQDDFTMVDNILMGRKSADEYLEELGIE